MSARYTGGLVYNAPGGWSGYFDGSGDYLSFATNQTPLLLSSSDFTFEAWVYRSSGTSTAVVFCGQSDLNTVGGSGYVFYVSSSASSDLYIGGSGYGISSPNPSVGAWAHVAWARTGGTYSSYLNGVRVATRSDLGTGAVNNGATNYAPSIGAFSNSGSPLTGYISNARLIKGSGGYDATQSTITIPSGPLNAVTNTSLLTCRYPTFVDGSTNALTITVNGNTAVSTVNPFPTSQLPNPALGGAGNGVYTMSQYAALKAANLWPAYDPYYKNVTLNLHGNAGAVLPFNTDASTNNFQVTQVGDTRPSNYTPFITNGYWSNYFDGSSYLQVAYNSALDASTGPFTYEAWLNPSTTTNKQYLGGSVTNAFFAFVGSGTIFVGRNNVAVDFTSSTGINTNQWNHVVIVRNSSNNIAIFINGVSAYYNASNTNNYGLASNPLRIGVATTGSSYEYSGYISNVRIAKSALYDPTASTITVPTSPLTAGSAGLLTCQSNRFVDNSSNAFAITTSGSPSVNPLQPFTAPTGTSAYGSGYFDGSGDSLTSSNNSAFNLGSNNFTVEAWVYVTATPGGSGAVIIGKNSATYPGGYEFNFVVDTGRTIFFGAYTTTLVSLQGAIVTSLNSWNHVAAVRSGSNWALFVNGVRDVTATSSGTIQTTSSSLYVGDYGGGSRNLTGYISNVRLVNGSAVYDPTVSTLTIPTSPLTAITNTSLLTVQTNAPSQNNTFLDSSTNNFTITRNGNTTQGTFTPYGNNWSNYFDGSGDYLSAGSSISLSSNFTVEGWMYRASSSGNGAILFNLGNDYYSTGATFFVDPSTGYLRIYTGQAHLLAGTSGVVTLNTWSHVAFVRNSNTLRAYLNGVQVDSASWSATISGTAYINLEANGFPTQNLYPGSAGYLSNVRVNTTAVYTAAFTPSTVPLPAITGTQLLTCQSNRFVDNSTNAYTITKTGDTSVQRFSPFSPTTAYSTSVIGGSGYFDGSGDYLSASTASAVAFGTGDFCVEMWIFPTTLSSVYVPFDSRGGGTGVAFYTNGATINVAVTGVATWFTGATITANAWTHIAVTRSSSTARLFVNGALISSGTQTTNFGNNTTYIGQDSYAASQYWPGYIADVRVVKGSAVYTAAFTPPTTPLTAITNTSLLLSYTNAGILDNAMMTDWETLGSAQLNTAYKKYGSGSISMLATGDYCRSTYPSTIGDINGGDFTIEFWVYFTSVAANRALISKYGNTAENAGGLGYVLQFQQSIPSLRFVLGVGGGTDAVYDFSWSPAISTWYHVAVTRSGSSARAFINGSQIGSTTTVSTSDVASPNSTQIGKTHTVSQYLLGYMDDIRVTKGVARYTANFTPPTSQVQDQ